MFPERFTCGLPGEHSPELAIPRFELNDYLQRTILWHEDVLLAYTDSSARD